MNSAWKPVRMPGSTRKKSRNFMTIRYRGKTSMSAKKLKLIAGKLRSRWDGPFVITKIFPHGVVQLKDEHTNSTFQVNGHQI
ncbi:hypothetical protein CR513_46392, partial [Mucuna pruriens]